MVETAVVSGRLVERMQHVEDARVYLSSIGALGAHVRLVPVQVAFGVDRPLEAPQEPTEAVQRGR